MDTTASRLDARGRSRTALRGGIGQRASTVDAVVTSLLIWHRAVTLFPIGQLRLSSLRVSVVLVALFSVSGNAWVAVAIGMRLG